MRKRYVYTSDACRNKTGDEKRYIYIYTDSSCMGACMYACIREIRERAGYRGCRIRRVWNRQMRFNRLTFLVIVYFVSHTEHTVCIVEKSGRLIHNHFVRIQDFLLKHLQRGHRLVKRVKILGYFALLVKIHSCRYRAINK